MNAEIQTFHANKQDFLDYNYNNYFVSLLEKCLNDSDCPQKYIKELKIILNRQAEKKRSLDTIMERKQELGEFAITKFVQDKINIFNSHRLDMVWSRNLIETIIAVAQINLYELSLFLDSIKQLNGYLSYGLYFLRGGLDLLNLLKNTLFTNSFYESEKIDWRERLTVQWRLRYGRIMNDIILWAPVNMATFHWLTGNGGNFLTVFLLIGDFLMTWITAIDKDFYHLKMQEELKSMGIADILQKHHENIQNDLNFVMNYQIGLIASFSLIAVSLLFNPTNIPLLVLGGISCFTAQFIINLKDYLLGISLTSDDEIIRAFYIDIAQRMFVQALIPSMAILTGIFLIPMLPGIPMWFLLSANIVMATQLLELTQDIAHYFKKPSSDITQTINHDLAISTIRLTSLIGMGMMLTNPAHLVIGLFISVSSITLDIFLKHTEQTPSLKSMSA